jgi:hypothetical protein
MPRLIESAVITAVLALPFGAFADSCNPTSRATCAVPFPSDFWAQPDANSATGVRLDVPDDVVRPELLSQLPTDGGFSPAKIFADATGFSAASAVVFEFNGEPDAATLPKDGGNAVLAWNLTRGQPVDVRAAVSDYAQSGSVSTPADAIEIFPRDRWGWGDRILVAVTDQLAVVNDGETVAGLCADEATGSAGADYCNELMSGLAAAGLPASQTRAATLFTVRDQDNATGRMQQAVNDTWQADHAVRNLDTRYFLARGDVVARVTGEVRLDNYRRDNNTGIVDFDAEPEDYWTSFRLTLPKAAKSGSVPVVFYAHGLGLNKESDALVNQMNAGLGLATFSIDFPNHGDRNDQDGGYVLTNLNPESLPTQVGMMTQATIDFAGAHKALKTALAEVDVLNKPDWWRWCWACSDGTPDIDPSQVMMMGTSLGGVLGSTYATLSPDLDAALFHVTGVGISSILSDSVLWDLMFSGLMPEAANGAEALMLRGAVQQTLDYGDAINFLDQMRTPQQPRPPRPLMIITGAGDSLVTNDSSVAAARLAELPIVGEQLYDMPGVMAQNDYGPEGFGIRHYPPLTYPVSLGDFIDNATGHVIFLRGSAMEDQEEWIERFFLN